MARRRRPRELQTRTAATLLSLAFSSSTGEALLTSSSNALAKDAHSRAVAVQHHCSIPGSGHRIALSAVPPSRRRGACAWRPGAAALGAIGSDDEGAAITVRYTRLVQAAAVLRMAAADKAVSAGPADKGQQQGQDQDRYVGKKRAMLRRMRRRAKAKIKTIPTPARVLDSPPGGGGRRAKISGVKNRPRARIDFGRSGGGSGGSRDEAGVADGGGEGRGGDRRQKRSLGVGAVGSAVFGTPARFVRRKVYACRSFVASLPRVHWASLAMAMYIFTTSVVPRLPTRM